MENIDQHIKKDKEILSDPTVSPQMRRHIEGELSDLEHYKDRHPNDTHDPTALELSSYIFLKEMIISFI